MFYFIKPEKERNAVTNLVTAKYYEKNLEWKDQSIYDQFIRTQVFFCPRSKSSSPRIALGKLLCDHLRSIYHGVAETDTLVRPIRTGPWLHDIMEPLWKVLPLLFFTLDKQVRDCRDTDY